MSIYFVERSDFMEKGLFVTAKEVSEILGISVPLGYKIIAKLNGELREKGYITFSGRLNRKYFEEKCLYQGERVTV